MGELLAKEAVADSNKAIMVETHSQNLMIRLRTLIAKGELKREDVALYYVDYDQASFKSNLREVTIKENGEVENWPEHMFKETLNEALALRNAQMVKKA
jgi:predicted ATPase